jgi:type II secretory pathway predicted ATPase ExeA
MSRGLSELPPTSVSGEFPAGRFFYSNLRIQEMLTTIRYGVEARKGLVLIIGEAGIGKTTLLHKVATASSANVTCIVESDPRVNFTDVLRLILGGLAVESADADEPAMLRSCQRELRARLGKCQIVALMFDNAHHLSEQTLQHIIQNFLGGSAEDPDGTLLQLVLAGRPELKVKLAQTALFQLRRRTPISCELEPLNSQEIGSYIEQGLRSNDRPAELFDARAVKRIALYSKGNPRSVNAICERAAQVANGSGSAGISAELIDDIARDLNFRESAVANETTMTKFEKKFETAHEPEPFRRFQFAPSEDYTEVVGQTFLNYNRGDERQGSLRQPKRKTAWVSVMLFLIVLAGTGAWMGAETARDSLTYWSEMLPGIIARLQQSQTGAGESDAALESITKAEPRAPLPPAPVIPPPREPDQASNVTEMPAESSLEPPIGNNGTENGLIGDAKPQPKAPPLSNHEPRAPLKASSNQPLNQDLQLQIIKAIENRAIIGVEVSVVRGIAYLHGHVATERQRRAAERAARSVSDVIQVHNRIVVD